MKKAKLPSYIGKPLYISKFKNISMGRKCRIYPGIRIEMVDKNSYLTIGENVSIGQNCHIVSYNNNLCIGNNCTISGNVFISNVNHSYEKIGISVLEQDFISQKTIVGNCCFLGYGSVILPGTELGDNCVVGANSVVKGVFEDNCVIAGNPAKVIKKYDAKNRNWSRVG